MTHVSLAGATVLVPDLDRAIAAYGDFLGYRGAAPERVGDARAQAWGAPACADARVAILRPEGGGRFIRLIEGAATPGFRPLTTRGWTAIEIVVQDVRALAARLADSPFRIIGAPAKLEFEFTDALSAMQVEGPGGEILYLTQIDGAIPGFDLPRADQAVGELFIMVLASTDLSAAGAFYAGLGRPAGAALQAPIGILSEAHGLPADHRHSLTTVALDDRSLIEIDAFPHGSRARPLGVPGLPCGVAMVSLLMSDREAGMLTGADGEWIELLATT